MSSEKNLPNVNFSPASASERFVHGAQAPGFVPFEQWIQFMRENGIGGVLCLLHSSVLRHYECYHGLIDRYVEVFGDENVKHVGVVDGTPVPSSAMPEIFRFLRSRKEENLKVVVHCQAGYGRTGMVLAAWNAIEGGMSAEEAVRACKSAGATRDPTEFERQRGQTKTFSEWLGEVREAIRRSNS